MVLVKAGPFWTKETYAGSDLSGSDGAANRVLTLSNTILTHNVIVALDSHLKEDTDYTVSHKASGTTVTFSVKVWNDQQGEVLYE